MAQYLVGITLILAFVGVVGSVILVLTNPQLDPRRIGPFARPQPQMEAAPQASAPFVEPRSGAGSLPPRRALSAPVASPLDELLEEPTSAAPHALTIHPSSVPERESGDPEYGPLPLTSWVPYANRQPHLLVCAKTRKGKSTLVRYFLRERILAGEKLMIIDPHWAPDNWWGLPGAGGAEDFDEIRQALSAVTAEYKSRLQRHKEGFKDFIRLTVVIDEAVSIKTQIDTKQSSIWPDFVSVLGSGAAKVKISVVVMTQSPNVSDLGVSSPLRENYARICLDGHTIKMLIDGDEPLRRRHLRELLSDQGDWPAAMDIENAVMYLDRHDILSVAKPPLAEAALWDGWYNVQQDELPLDLPAAQDQADAPIRTREDLVRFLVDQGLGTAKIRELVKIDNNALSELMRRITTEDVDAPARAE